MAVHIRLSRVGAKKAPRTVSSWPISAALAAGALSRKLARTTLPVIRERCWSIATVSIIRVGTARSPRTRSSVC